MITARSYCTGYTGLEMAVRAAFGDFEVLGHSDIKPAACALLDHHYPHIPNLGDMRAIDYTALDRADLMIGSWPCQPHSAAGKRLGEADHRDLWPEYLRAIDAHRPAIFFGENVNSIVSSGELRRVATSLAARGYVGAWVVRAAADVGACHLRKRCFVVAVASDAVGEAGRLTRHAEPEYRADQACVRALEPGRRDSGSLTLLPTPNTRSARGIDPRGRRSAGGGCAFDPQTEVFMLPTPTASDHKGFGPLDRRLSTRVERVAVAEELPPWGKYTPAIQRHEAALGRPAPESTHAGLTTSRRQLAARFVEWMMMLPAGWVCDVPDLDRFNRRPSAAAKRSAMLSLLGDGVVPAQGAAAFSFLLDHLTQRLASERVA